MYLCNEVNSVIVVFKYVIGQVIKGDVSVNCVCGRGITFTMRFLT